MAPVPVKAKTLAHSELPSATKTESGVRLKPPVFVASFQNPAEEGIRGKVKRAISGVRLTLDRVKKSLEDIDEIDARPSTVPPQVVAAERGENGVIISSIPPKEREDKVA